MRTDINVSPGVNSLWKFCAQAQAETVIIKAIRKQGKSLKRSFIMTGSS
jgi:hypothetical protein